MRKKHPPRKPMGAMPGGDSAISRRNLLSAGGASAAILVLSPRGAAVPSVIPIPSAAQAPATHGYAYLVTISPDADTTLSLTKVTGAGGAEVAAGLDKAVVSPDRQSVAYAQTTQSPLQAPATYRALSGDSAQSTWTFQLPGLGSGPSFTNSCVLPGRRSTVVTCCDLADSSVVEHTGDKKPGRAVTLRTRTVVIARASGIVSLPLPLAENGFIGAEVSPIDDRYAAVITSGLSRQVTGKAGRSAPPNTRALCHVVDTVKGEVCGSFPVLAGPGAASEISSGNGVIARVVGGPMVELIYPTRPPVTYEAPLVPTARRYVPAGHADPAAGTLVLFDFAAARLMRLDLGTGRITARGALPLTRDVLPRATRPASDVDPWNRQLLLADPGNARSGVWVVDLDTLTVADRWLSLLPVGDICVIPGTGRVAVRASGSATALLVDRNGRVSGHFGLTGKLA